MTKTRVQSTGDTKYDEVLEAVAKHLSQLSPYQVINLLLGTTVRTFKINGISKDQLLTVVKYVADTIYADPSIKYDVEEPN